MEPKHVLETLNFIKEAFELTYKSRDYYECKSELIEVSDLDFNSGEPGDGEQFIRPFSYSRMHQFLEEIRPWDNPDGCPSILPIDTAVDDAAQARDRPMEHDQMPGIIEGTKWKLLIPEESHLLFRLSHHTPWNVENFIDQCDYEKPHMGCYLANNLPLKEIVPSISETQTILWVTGSRFMDEGYQNHKVVPVTFLSGSGSSVRVVGGYIDRKKLYIRLTPIVDFVEGEKKKWNEFVQYLCWIVGDPIGNTT
ncbi:hypothetical protein F4813DRAFT_396618 [Daldinia decipiens]|uniref:uncharacterized protein n=1 Tax=Daldinia decipiens TaxID=326647 RepID=UPI0020C3B998|nr:uncharacterized protein F4813DRAFT_396618 [Daldinia decipiens]KAI1657074.1 hypothetical protein F4813DRAFT_396618 [Daldinia decipiens]